MVDGDAVVDGSYPIRVWQPFPLLMANGHQPLLGIELVEATHLLEIEPAMCGRHRRCLRQSSQSERKVVVMVVEQVELPVMGIGLTEGDEGEGGVVLDLRIEPETSWAERNQSRRRPRVA